MFYCNALCDPIGMVRPQFEKRKIQFSPAIPPLMAVERHFFCLFAMGEALLTLTLISGTYHVLQAVTPENLHKAIFFFPCLD